MAVTPAWHPSEREADRVADAVVRIAEPRVQRTCACGGSAGAGGECAECRSRRLALQRTGQGSAPAGAPASVHAALSGPAAPLHAGDRAFMEARFGYDFGRVRVHQGTEAAESARGVNALAYTVGHHVVFGTGSYSPGTDHGRRLLAHELVHVIQQDGGGSTPVQRAPARESGDDEAAAAPVAAAPEEQVANDGDGTEELQKRGGCGGVIAVPHAQIRNFTTVGFNIRQPCSTAVATLTAQWVNGACEDPGAYTASVGGQSRSMNAGFQGIEEECPGTPPQRSTATFTGLAAGRRHLRISTGGGQMSLLDVRGSIRVS
ncbi:MAG: DUF4157 domain-containing protein [Gemmatimonadetes bacterium]|nr:DUF4157 domain-containing protein [Gemmatimonadota bacterium]